MKSARVAESLRILSEKSLPRPATRGFEQVFSGDSLIPSATEEKALFLDALQGEIIETLESLDGVISARVHLVLPERDPLNPEAAVEPMAAVALRTEGGMFPESNLANVHVSVPVISHRGGRITNPNFRSGRGYESLPEPVFMSDS